MALTTDIVCNIALYTDYETTLNLATFNKDLVRYIANSNNYFWKRKYLCENKIMPKSNTVTNWAIAYLIKTQKYYGNIFQKKGKHWKKIIDDAYSIYKNIILTNNALYIIDNHITMITDLPGNFNDILYIIEHNKELYCLKDDGKLIIYDIYAHHYHYINLPHFIADIRIYNNKLLLISRKETRYFLDPHTKRVSLINSIDTHDSNILKLYEHSSKYICQEGRLHSIFNKDKILFQKKISNYCNGNYFTLDKKLYDTNNNEIYIDNTEKILDVYYDHNYSIQYALCL